VHALDAKVSLDNNAGFRHPEWDEFRATEELDAREQLAREHDLQYIGLDGTVGIIANGAGLAMSTLDVVNQVGGKAANFLDIGGGANADVMAAALGVINFDENVKSDYLRKHCLASAAVMEAQGSVLTNKYAEGYPGKRWYGGCENVDTVETLAIERAKKLFGAEHANVQPHCGSACRGSPRRICS